MWNVLLPIKSSRMGVSMGTILKFDSSLANKSKKDGPPDALAIKLVNFSGEVDSCIIHYMKMQHCDAAELAVVLANRLGQLLHQIGDNKDALYEFCTKVIRDKADVA